MAEPWERQPGESAKAFVSFAAYRDLGPLHRSQAKTHEITGANRRTIEMWSKKYEWQKRVSAWDAEVDRQRRIKNLEDIEAMRDEHAKIAKSMLVKSAQALVKIPIDEIKASDISRMVEVASKLERISRGDVGEVVEERDGGKAVNPVQFYLPDNHRQDTETEEHHE